MNHNENRFFIRANDILGRLLFISLLNYNLGYPGYFLSLFLRKKSNQKSRPKTNTARFRDGPLMEHFCYCDFSFISLLLSHFSVVRTIAILFERWDCILLRIWNLSATGGFQSRQACLPSCRFVFWDFAHFIVSLRSSCLQETFNHTDDRRICNTLYCHAEPAGCGGARSICINITVYRLGFTAMAVFTNSNSCIPADPERV